MHPTLNINITAIIPSLTTTPANILIVPVTAITNISKGTKNKLLVLSGKTN